MPRIENWSMRPTAQVPEPGEIVSTTTYAPEGWTTAVVPGSVVAGLVHGGLHPDPYIGLNMRSLPGYKLRADSHFSRHPMPADSPYRGSWWYRTTFELPSEMSGRQVWLKFRGINYRADIWLNGKRIAGADHVIGTFRGYDLDVTCRVATGCDNVLALEIFAPRPDDLSLTFIDWSPVPPDDGMGLWQPVEWYCTGAVALKHPFLSGEFEPGRWDRVAVNLQVVLANHTVRPVTCLLTARIDRLTLRQKVRVPPRGKRRVQFTPRRFPELIFTRPRLWWPYSLGEPHLYRLDLDCEVDGQVSDRVTQHFGLRDVRSRVNAHGARVFTINGQDVLIRGAAWVPDLMLRQSAARDAADVALLKNMHLNAIRFEGKLGSDEIWELCDREGILVLAGWPCCNHWERWREWKPGDARVAEASLRWQMLRLRNHPSLIAWLYGSDFPPPEPVERMYLRVLRETHPKLPALSSASATPSALGGPTGFKMSGPNKYVPPAYWYDVRKPGCAESFNLETCPDACIPVYESLCRFLPGDSLRPGSPAWNHHAGVAAFADTDEVNDAVSARYGVPADPRDFAAQAQVLGYEAWRAMFEAYGRNYPRGTGVIGWQLNSAWPSVFWQLYDYYLQPNGAFYGTQKACEPLHLQYSYDDASIWALNTTLKAHCDLTARVAVVEPDGSVRAERSLEFSLDAQTHRRLMVLPDYTGTSPVYFVFLSLLQNGRGVARNVYWLATRPDVFEPQPQKKFFWPLRRHADLSALRGIPAADLSVEMRRCDDPADPRIEISGRNRSDHVAFFLWLKLVDGRSGELMAPLCWNENGLTLQAGECWPVRVHAVGEPAGHLAGAELRIEDAQGRLLWHDPVGNDDSGRQA